MPTTKTLGAFQFEDPRQERIYHRLLLVGPGPAAFYQDACRFMAEERPLASTTHLVAHLTREIESSLRDVLETVTDQAARLKKGAKGEEQHKDEIRAILKVLEIPETDTVTIAWLRLPGCENGLASRAHREDLAAPRPVDADFREFWNEIETIFDKVLERFEERYTAWHKQFDLLAQQTSPTTADAKFLRLHFPNNLAASGDFFNRLSTPAWLQPLAAEGLFDHPPQPEHDEIEGRTRLWAWPQSRYLARMAQHAPEEVVKIILDIPETKNSWVHNDFVEAALAMPSDLAAQLVPKMNAWVEGGYVMLVLKKLGNLLEQLALGDQIPAALELTRSLLKLIPAPTTPEQESEAKEDEIKALLRDQKPRPKFDAWEYGEIVRNNLPSLVEKAGEQVLPVLCDLLEDAVRLSMPQSEKPTANDISHAWRPAIEDHGQNSDYDVKTRLVEAVRDAAKQIASSDPGRIPAIIRSFRKRRMGIFLRLAHHLLRTFPEAEPQIVTRTLMCRGLLNKARLWHEYALMLRESFHRLTSAEKEKILGWIERGPDERKYARWHQKFFGAPATEQQVANHTKVWKRDLLALICEDLPAEWKTRFLELTAEFGDSEHPEFASYRSGGAFGYQTPKAAVDLAPMTIGETIEFLKTWIPSTTDWMAPSPEGLGRELMALVVNDCERFAEAAEQFCGLDPTYVRAIIQGLEEAAKKNSKFGWPQVLKLCRWVVEQPRDIPGRLKNQREADPDWGWTLKAISSLLTVGLQSESNPTPFERRTELWAVIEKLAADQEPTVEDEAEYVRCKMAPVEISLNAGRPKAMHAAMTYALWVKRNMEAGSAASASREFSFHAIPEVRKVLDEHLDPQADRSVGVRSIYGQWLPSLFALDKAWLAENTSRVFPAEAENEHLLKAAWDSYVIGCPPSGQMLELLREQYKSAIRRVPAVTPESKYPRDSSERLAEHLLLLYGWGKLEATDPILEEFFAKTPERIRGHGFRQLGFGLYHEKGTPLPEIIERLKTLWEQRIAAAKSAGEKRIAELWTFGWWFASDKFDDDWALSQLAEVLSLTGKVEVDHLVLQRLAKLAEKRPPLTVACLGLMVDGAKEPYEIVGWEKDARTVLSSALKGSDDQARTDAIALINRLDARGHSSFRELLDGTA